ncbi:Crp/Fnr family transcriptional regulator [Alphaproteobacteria bacterium KMM 3653]|uniref:Crp/Fnr family transcriptional regulator n=1 Tax=Harenicola maris TaxID=2841044 RepID=A0AAP2CQ41_9RHOB|nr:Crp/Fnr family transcriptional regulator [Harenicola maris]
MTPELRGQTNCEACPIRHRAVCASCDTEELLTLESIKYYTSFKAGETIVMAHDPMSFVASLVSGTATLEHLTEDGRKQTVGLLLPSDFIGRPEREAAVYDVVAITDVTLCCFRRTQFEQLLASTPHITGRMLEMTLDELDAARAWMVLLGRKTAREKLASFLLLILKRTVADTPPLPAKAYSIDLPLTREEIANYLGLTIETVSRQFSKLKAEGLIRIESSKTVTIPDAETLAEEAGSAL